MTSIIPKPSSTQESPLPEKPSHPPTLLIDGDVYAYQAASATERVVTFDNVNFQRVGSLPDAVVSFENKLASLLKRFKTASYIIALTDVDNFRKDLLPSYKGNRNPREKPFCLTALRAHILAEHKTYQRPGLEADDVLGILATSARIFPKDTRRVIVSVDKDMLSIPGEYYNSKLDILYATAPEEAAYRHCFQTLTGDPTDGYHGCPKVGPRKAERILDGLTGYAELWPAVVAAFENAGLTEADALVQARMARILHASDYDFQAKKVRLWEPPNLTQKAAPRPATTAKPGKRPTPAPTAAQAATRTRKPTPTHTKN